MLAQDFHDTRWISDLYHLGQMVAREPSSDQALHRILERITRRAGAATGCLALRDSEGRSLSIVAGIDLPPQAIGSSIAFGQGVLGWVAEHQQALLLNGDISKDPRFRNMLKRRTPGRVSSAMCWPLIAEKEVIGVLSLNRDEADAPFTEQDMEQAETLVSHVTIVIENTRLHRSQGLQMASLAQANVRIALLSEVQSKFIQADSCLQDAGKLEVFKRELLEDLCVIAGTPFAVMTVYADNGTLDRLHAHGLNDAQLTMTKALLGSAACIEEVVVSNDLKGRHGAADACRSDVEDCPLRSVLALPLVLDGRNAGMLLVADNNADRQFDANDELVLGMLANNMSLLLERLRLIAELHRANQVLEQEQREQKQLISRLESAQEELRESHRTTVTTLESISDAFVALDENWGLTYVNSQAEELLGARRSEVLGNIIWDQLPELAGTFFKPLNFVMTSRKTLAFEGYYPPLARWLECHVYPADKGISIYFRDISKRKQHEQEQQAMIEKLREAKEQLLQSEKLASIGQLAAGVAHEINNPVGYITSNIGTLRQYLEDLFGLIDVYQQAEGALAGQHDALLATIRETREDVDLDFLRQDVLDLMNESEEGVRRVKQIVQDLKDFSHVDKGEWEFANLHKGLDSTLNIVHNEIKYKADVIREYGDLPEVECLSSQINQVFMNLLVNAAHAIEDRGTITIRTGSDESGVWVEVEDTGKGIEACNLKKIFDPFFTTKPVGKGTGLGLSLSYGIIKKHGGSIDVRSRPGAGTCFRVSLPSRQAREPATGRKTGQTQAG